MRLVLFCAIAAALLSPWPVRSPFASDDLFAELASGAGAARMAETEALEKLRRAAGNVARQMFHHENPDAARGAEPREDDATAQLWLKDANACATAAAAALAVGLPAGYPVAFSNHGSSLPTPTALGAFRERICEPASKLAEQRLAKAKQAKSEKNAPFLALLTADKKRIFENAQLADSIVLGPGKRPLRTPEDFAAANAWYKTSVRRFETPPRWDLSGWHFDGGKLLRPYSDSGLGSEVPSARLIDSGGAEGGGGSGAGFLNLLSMLALLAAASLVATRLLGLRMPILDWLLSPLPRLRRGATGPRARG